MSIIEDRSDGGSSGTTPVMVEASILTRRVIAYAIWVFLLTLLSAQSRSLLWMPLAGDNALYMWIASIYMIIVLELIVPAFLLTRIGHRWTRIDSTVVTCFLAFMAWGAALYFWPFPPHGLRPASSPHPYPMRERLGYGVFAIFYGALWLTGSRLGDYVSKTIGSSRSSPTMMSLITGGTIAVCFWIRGVIWYGMMHGASAITLPSVLLATLKHVMLGTFVGFLVFSFASALGYGVRRSSAPRRVRIILIASWLGLVALWVAAIGVQFMPPRRSLSSQSHPTVYPARPPRLGALRAVAPPDSSDDGDPATTTRP